MADHTEHVKGAGCPACLTFDDWANAHCYSCGGVFPDRAIELQQRIDDLTGEEYDELNVLTAEHEACFK